MQKEIHFYEYNPAIKQKQFFHSWNETEKAIHEKLPYIETTQMGLLSAQLFEQEYRIFIHENPDSTYEIKLGCENSRTNREIRMAHNLFKMWRSGEFAIR